MEHHEGYDPDAEPRFWFVLDLEIAREHAKPLVGPHPRELVGELDVRDALRESLAWWRDYGGQQALMAACRTHGAGWRPDAGSRSARPTPGTSIA